MNPLTEEQTRELEAIDSRHLDLPGLGPQQVTTSWHYWLAFDELQSWYGWSEAELLALVAQEQSLTGRHLSGCFEVVVTYAYADCRHELAGACDAPTWLPLPGVFQVPEEPPKAV